MGTARLNAQTPAYNATARCSKPLAYTIRRGSSSRGSNFGSTSGPATGDWPEDEGEMIAARSVLHARMVPSTFFRLACASTACAPHGPRNGCRASTRGLRGSNFASLLRLRLPAHYGVATGMLIRKRGARRADRQLGFRVEFN